MNANETALLDPFEISTPDEATELAALTRALELAESFRLLFVCCNQIPQRERLMQELRTRLPNLNIQTVFFREPIQHLLDSIQEQLNMPMPDAVFVSGLEFSLPVAAEAHAAPLIANLNASRNSFAQLLPCPVVLWVPEYVLTAIAQGAPDFFSIRSGVYFFAAMPAEIAYLASSLSAENLWEISSLSNAEKQDRISALKRLLADYELLADKQRDRRTELLLTVQLGTLFYSQGEYDAALTRYEYSLKIAEELGNHLSIAISLHQIGMIHQERGDYEVAMTYYNQSLKIAASIGYRAGVASAVHQMGRLYQARGEYDMALRCYEQSRKILEDLGDRGSLVSSLHQIGNLHYSRKEYKKALAQYEESLQIAKDLGNRAGEAITLHQIGMVHEARGEYLAAMTQYEQSLKIAEELGDRAGVAITLHHTGRLHQERGEYDIALAQYEQSRRIFENIGDRAGVSSSRGQLGHLFTRIGRYQEAFEQLYLAWMTFMKLQSPKARDVADMLRTLRAKWGTPNFDAAWQQATGTVMPEWLLRSEGTPT